MILLPILKIVIKSPGVLIFSNFTLEKVFEPLIYEDHTSYELPWRYDMYSWDGYCEYLGSEERKEIKHPGPLVISYREYNPMGLDVEKVLDEDD